MSFKIDLNGEQKELSRDALVAHLEQVVRDQPNWFSLEQPSPQALKQAFDSAQEQVLASDDLQLICETPLSPHTPSLILTPCLL